MQFCEVIQPGLFTTVQDLGRAGCQHLGIPNGGAMDSYALRVANRLLGNDENAAALEMTLLGPVLCFTADTLIAVTGGDLSARLDGREMPMWETVFVHAGEQLTFDGVRSGCRAYLAVDGGIAVPAVLGSRSTYVRGRLGGLAGRTLKTGDVLAAGTPGRRRTAGLRVPAELVPAYAQEILVRVVLGPQDDYFPDQSIATFLSESYRVTADADRMGCRLEGAKLAHRQGADIISDAIPWGAVQVPGHGMPIVMLADRQTTGGYPKIAVVISADAPKMAQVKPGDTIRFCRTTVEAAQTVLRELEGRLARWQIGVEVDREAKVYNISVAGCLYKVTVRERR